MNKKITLTVNGNRFDIDVEERFALFLQKQMAKDLNMEGNNTYKALLQAYIRKNYELYEQEKEIAGLLERVEKS